MNIKKNFKNKKIVIGMSGGVDSAVCAYLMKTQFFNNDISGLFMYNWDTLLNEDFLGHKITNNKGCESEIDFQDVVKICNLLQINYQKVNFVQEYWDYVFKYFVDQYQKGHTPNPDVLCNKYIKFNAFLNYAEKELQADYIVMGHYARSRYNAQTKKYELLRAIDKSKDQTYFLSRITQKALQKAYFPIGNLLKSKVRQIAKENKINVANKKDSTGICFIGERNFTEFLQNYIPNQPGDIIDIDTYKKVGKHIGTMYYTIGQRKKLDIGGSPEPYYLVGKNVKKSIIFVSLKSTKDKWLISNMAYIKSVNFISSTFKINEIIFITVQFRYQQKEINAKLQIYSHNKVKVMYEPTLAVTPGQEAVFYQGKLCLGGGEISEVFNNNKKIEYV